MKHTLCTAALLALSLSAATAQAQDAPDGCAAALAPLPGKWEWMERAGARPFVMEIAPPGKDGCSVSVTAWWPHSPFDRHVWQFTARPGADGKGWLYTDARHWHERVMVPEGEAPKQDVKFEGGVGALRLDEGGVLLWDERKEGICWKCRFTKVAPSVAAAGVPAVPDALNLVAAQDISAMLRGADTPDGAKAFGLGAIGTGDDRRFQIIFFNSVQRNAANPLLYDVAGVLRNVDNTWALFEGKNDSPFTGTIEVQRASLLPRTPGNAARYEGYAEGVTRGSLEMYMELREDRERPGSGAMQGMLRVDVLHGKGGAITPDTRNKAGISGTGTRTDYESGVSAPLNFAQQRLSRDGGALESCDPVTGACGAMLIHGYSRPTAPPVRPPKP